MPKSDVGVLTVYMDAVTDQFHAGLQGAEKAVTTFRGQLKGLNRTFTEVKNKATVIAGVFEGVFKILDVIARLAKGDLKGSVEIIKELPFGFGLAMRGYEAFIHTIIGGEPEEKLAERLKKINEATAAWFKQLQTHLSTLREYASATRAASESTSVLLEAMNKGPEAAAALERDLARATAIAPIESKLAEAEAALDKFYRSQKKAYDKWLKEGAAHVGISEEEYKREWAGGKEFEVFNTKEMIQLKEQVDFAEAQLKAIHELHDTLEAVSVDEEHRALIARVVADAIKDQAENARALLKAQKDLAALQKTRDKITGQSLRGSANTFTSPMGTISLPALNTTAELARKQLTELQGIDQQIRELRAEIGKLTK